MLQTYTLTVDKFYAKYLCNICKATELSLILLFYVVGVYLHLLPTESKV